MATTATVSWGCMPILFVSSLGANFITRSTAATQASFYAFMEQESLRDQITGWNRVGEDRGPKLCPANQALVAEGGQRWEGKE
jgi:hypothetical protein